MTARELTQESRVVHGVRQFYSKHFLLRAVKSDAGKNNL